MKAHKYADLFPLLEGAEFERLVADIRENGLLEPIWLYEDQIIDGRNRYRACKKLGIEPKTRSYTGKDPIGLVVSLNLIRRHLDNTQRAVLGARLEPLYAEAARARQGTRTDIQPNLAGSMEGQARDKAAAMVGVSHSYVSMAKTTLTNAPELEDDMLRGELPLGQAYAIAKSSPVASVRARIFKEVQKQQATEPQTRQIVNRITGRKVDHAHDEDGAVKMLFDAVTALDKAVTALEAADITEADKNEHSKVAKNRIKAILGRLK